MALCLQKECTDLVKLYLPLCPLHYHQCVSGKTPEVVLKDGLGTARYNTTTKLIDYPAAVPKNRFPLPKSERPQKALAYLGTAGDLPRPVLAGRIRSETEEDFSAFTTFYLDSGAGQCLCSCSSAFISMQACHLQVVGVAGRLNIYGQGTAVFLISLDGQESLLRIHNCLHSYGEFNLISVSQLKLVAGNSVDFSVQSPGVKFSRSQSEQLNSPGPDFLEFALNIEDGLYSFLVEPISPSDPRFYELPVYNITLPGDFCPLNISLCASVGPANSESIHE